MRRIIPFIMLITLCISVSLLSPRPIAAEEMQDGDLIKTKDSFDIYIIKLKGIKRFKRLILNPEIFNSYGHLKWENVKTVSKDAMNEYKLSEFVLEVNPDGSVRDPKVYRITSSTNSDMGERKWLNITAAEFEALGYDWDSLYQINSVEASPNFYPTKDPLTYQQLLAEKPAEKPTVSQEPKKETPTPVLKDTTAPELSSINAVKILADSATITWNANENSSGVAQYGTAENALALSANATVLELATSTFSHTAVLSGLTENTKYYYQAISTDQNGNSSQKVTNSFTTTDCHGDVPSFHKTIQEAINGVVKPGGKICIAAGTFNGNIVIDGKDVQIIGKGAVSTIISATQAGETIVIKNVSASTSISNLSLKGGNPYAIRIEDASPIIKNNHIINNSAGIRVVGNSRPTIEYNVFANNLSGAAVAHNGNYGDYAIDHNTFTHNGVNASIATVLIDGVYPSSPIRVTNNIISNGFIGIYEASPSNFYLWNNLFYNNESVQLRRQNSFYYGATTINELSVSAKNIVADPLLDTAYKPKVNSPVLGAGTYESNIGAY